MTGAWHVGIVGLGTVGRALARALHASSRHASAQPMSAQRAHVGVHEPAAVRLTAVSSRRAGAAEALAATLPGVHAVPLRSLAAHVDLVVLAVSDTDVPVLAALPVWRDGQVLAHCAGALGADVIEVARQQGGAELARVHAGALHPMVSLPRGEDAPAHHFAGAVAAIAGDAIAGTALEALCATLALQPVRVQDADRARWHAAATLMGNAPAALLAHAEAMLAPLHLDPVTARRALLGLLDSVVRNLHALPPHTSARRAISGPLARGDTATVSRHREALASTPAERAAYDAATTLLSLALSPHANAPSHDP